VTIALSLPADLLFESDQSISPLESALVLLENMNEEFRIPQQDFESACTSLKEMVSAFIFQPVAPVKFNGGL